MINIIKYKSENQDFWLQKRKEGDNLELETEYAKIAPGIPLVNVSYRELFLEKCETYFEELLEEESNLKLLERWDSYEITRMFGKGLNPTSLKTTLNNVQYLLSKIKPQGDTVKVLEFGPGSGWSTVMLYKALKEKYLDKRIDLVSVDLSPHSIVATQNTLDYCQIPWQTAMNPLDISLLDQEDSIVTLIVGDFIEALSCQKTNTFDGFFSSHGTAYLSEMDYLKLFTHIKDKGKDNCPIVIDSLDPLYTVQLSKVDLILCSINPNLALKKETYVYGDSLVSNSKYFPSQEVKKLIQVHNEESLLFYKWNNFLFKKGKIGYIAQMLKSMTITTDVIEEYREDVYPSYLIDELLNESGIKNFKKQEDLPACPLYITNAGFILSKE